MIKKALITGITGQDGSYLAEFLLSKGYEVHGIIRRASTFNTVRIDSIFVDPHEPNARLFLHFGDLSDAEQISNLIYNIKPDEIYHLGAQSHVRVSFDIPEYTGNVTALGTVRLLEAIRRSGHKIKFYQASCYDKTTRILTKEGIKEYSEMENDDLVYTVNEKTNEIELKPVKRIIVENYKGEMFCFKNRRIDLMVTPNHRMLLQKGNKLFYEEASRVMNLISYKGVSDISLPSPIWKGKRKKKIVFSNHINLSEMHYNNFRNLVTEMDMKDYLYLLGIYIGDGYTASKRRQERYCSAKEYIKIKDKKGKFTKGNGKKEEVFYESNNIYFALPEKDKARSKVIKILKKYSLDYKIGPEWIRFSSYPMARIFKESGENVYSKRIPPWVLELSSELLERLFEGLIDSDGSRRKVNNERQTYITVSRELSEDFIALCLKIGRIPKISFCKPNQVYFKKENRFFNSKGSYRINIAYKKTRKIYNTNISKKNYDGKIWCLEVKDNHNFLVERNGFVAFSGNSSEMFGAAPAPQSESTVFYPQSPYACAKVYAYWMVKNYRDGYGLFACNGILFNHECVSENTPLIVRNKLTKVISIRRVKDIKMARPKGKNIQQWQIKNMEIWDGTKFTIANLLTATKRKKKDNNFECKIINTRQGIIDVTNHHNMIDCSGKKIKAGEVKVGERLYHEEFPRSSAISSLSIEEAVFLGMMVGDGYISEKGKASFSNNDAEIREKFEKMWARVSLGTVLTRKFRTEYGKSIRSALNGGHDYLRSARNEIYTFDGYKKVPDRILNADKDIQLAFLEGYNCTDGLKSNPCTYKFKNFKTNSNILLQGLLFLISQTTGQKFNLTFEENSKYYGYYSANLLSTVDNQLKEVKVRALLNQGKSQREINRFTGVSRKFIRKIQEGGKAELEHVLSKDKLEVKKFLYHKIQPEWVYDIETESGKFMAGVGTMVISNSPRRGETFVTRKITRGLANIMAGRQKKLYLGNLDAKRDWGFAPEYIELMWEMLQQDKPDDYVVGTAESHSVQELVKEAFDYVGLKWKKYVEIDPHYFRPTEVNSLIADIKKVKKVFEWQPKVNFQDLVRIMIDADMRASGLKPPGEGDKILQKKFPGRWWRAD